ncbi:MAG: glutamyl-tRNA reductase, partial [Chloroflexota bacterium]
MQLSLVGINHHTAPVAIREKAAVRAGQLPLALSRLQDYAPHGIILSTCNRTEVYTTGNDSSQTEEATINFLRAYLDVSAIEAIQHADVVEGQAVVEHLFRTAAGLDSMIVGEYEVLGQVGQALETAEQCRMVNLPLRHLFQSAVRTGRRVREETGISQNALSVSSVAVELATRVVGDLTGCRLLVIGAGEAGRLVAKAARDRGTPEILVASRTRQRAEALAASLNGVATELEQMDEMLPTCHLLVTCADAPHWIVNARQVAAAMARRPRQPLVIIDIAVPRNVEPAVRQIQNVRLYDMDDLSGIAESNRRKRAGEVPKAEALIEAGVEGFLSWWRAFRVQPVVSA